MEKKILITVICIALNINSYGEVDGRLQTEDQKELQKETQTKEYEENYASKYEREEYSSMSTGKKIFYGGVGLATAVGIALVADELKTDDDGTTIEIGDKPEELETSTLAINEVNETSSRNKDLYRTLLAARDISSMYQDLSMNNIKKEEDNLEIFVEGMEGKGEYTALSGGAYGIKTFKRSNRYKIKGSVAYSHAEVDYENDADGRADTIHTGLHFIYEQEKLSNYTWLANEFSYNKFEDEGSDNYSTNYLRIGNEISYELEGDSLSIRPYMMIEGGWLWMESIEVDDSKSSDEDYYSLRWGPGIEVVSRIDGNILGKVRVGYIREEGNIYDDFYIENTTTNLRVKDIEGRNSLELQGEISFKLKYGEIYGRGKYIWREESDSLVGTLGFRYAI